MKKVHIFVCLAVLLWSTSAAIGQGSIFGTQCDPCAPACEPITNPCDPCGGDTGFFTAFNVSGWLDMGVYTNGNGGGNNGPMLTGSKRRTDFVMNQLYLSAEKEMNTRRGFDWGARADFVYGAHAGSMQTWGNETFDYEWGRNRHGYNMSAYKLYGTLGYKDLSVKVGKFSTPIGWESSASKNNFFYSHSYCYWIEPATHMGILADYKLSKNLTVNAGWTTGEDSSFDNPSGNSALLAGFTYALADDLTAYYWIGAGKQNHSPPTGIVDPRNALNDYFCQSLCFEWAVTKRFTYVNQYNLRNDNIEDAGGKTRYSTYGINNHFLYKLNDQWGVGARFEWLRDNGGYVIDDAADYYQITLGLNWNPRENVSIRPEIRYDWCRGAIPFANLTQKDQVAGGLGTVISF